jgi:hypothetical protein
MSLRTSASSLLAVAAIACVADPTQPAPPPGYSLDISAAAPDVPNVWRYQDHLITGVRDPITDLWAYGGLPDDPRQLVRCGGTELFTVVDVHDAGVRQQVIHELYKASNVNIHVYRASTFTGFCTSVPLAQGTGVMRFVDNDFNLTSGRVETYGNQIEGRVTLANGETAHLSAHNRWQIAPDGSEQVIVRRVLLSRP